MFIIFSDPDSPHCVSPLRRAIFLAAALIFAFVSIRSHAQTCTPVPAGIVSWWSAEGTTEDRIGGNNGSMGGGSYFGTGEVNQGFIFDGSSGYIDLGSPGNLQLQDFTIEGWIKRSDSSVSSLVSPYGVIISYGQGGYGVGLWNDGRLFLTHAFVNNQDFYVGLTDTNNFHHIAVTKSGTTVIAYLDGVAFTAPPYTETFTFDTSISIGAGGDLQDSSFFGAIDELAVYNRALTATEIQNIYLAGQGGKCLSGDPVITLQPTDQTAFATRNVTFTTATTGDLPMTYQWFFDDVSISGATNFSLTLTNLQADQAGPYMVVVSNPDNSALSQPANLTVNPAPLCDPAPSNIVSWWSAEGNAIDNVGGVNGTLTNGMAFAAGEVEQGFLCNGNNSAVQLGNPPSLRLQNFTIEAWVKRLSSTSSSLATPNASIFSYGFGGYGFGLWNDGRLFLTRADVDNLAVGVGFTDTTSFHHVAVAKSGTNVVFYFDGVAFPAPPYTSVFTFTNSVAIGAQGDNDTTGFYGVIDELAVYSRQLSSDEIQNIYNAGVGGKCPPPKPLIYLQPASQSVAPDQNVAFSVGASSDLPLSYQWYFNATNISGATNFVLTLTNVQTTQAGAYSVLVSNPTNAILSQSATLTVIPPPPCDPAPSNIVSWWSAESNALDNVGGVNGVLTNGMGFSQGEVGHGFLCNGTNSAVQLGNPASLQLQNFTIEAWVKRFSSTASSLVAPNASLISYGTGGYGFGVWNDGRLFLTQANVNNEDAGVGFTDTNIFHHVALTKSNTEVIFYFDGVAFPEPAYSSVFTFNTPIAIGAEGDTDTLGFYGVIDELAVYNRKLSASEIQNIYSAGASGKCALSLPPAIYSQPSNQTASIGGSATFSVAVTGSPLLTYQWSMNQTNIPGATNSSLTVTNLQPTAGSSYTVLVTNLLGHTLSSNATLVVNPQLQVGNTVVNGSPAVVPINLLAGGNENSLQFSVSFNPSLLTYAGVSLGSNAASGFITANTNQLPSGRLGIFILLPSDATFASGVQQVARVSFNPAPVTNTVTSSIAFGDQPTLRQIADAQDIVIPTTYAGGRVTIPFLGYEGDLAPRTNGDNVFALADWQQVGRFVAGLDFPTNGNEFQRADCAPRATLGDGLLNVADWVQTLRYVTGSDPMVQGGGPTQSNRNSGSLPSALRTLTAVNATVQACQSCQVSIQLNSQGNEDAVGFSLAFDPSVLSFTSATIGSGASGATFLLNTNRAANGAVGIALELPFFSTFAAGTQEVAKLNFSVLPLAVHNLTISFTNFPVLQDVADANAADLATGYQNGTLSISNSLLNLSASVHANGKLALSWSSALAGFNLESNTNLGTTNWVIVSSGLTTNAGTITVTNSTSGTRLFYRLHHP